MGNAVKDTRNSQANRHIRQQADDPFSNLQVFRMDDVGLSDTLAVKGDESLE